MCRIGCFVTWLLLVLPLLLHIVLAVSIVPPQPPQPPPQLKLVVIYDSSNHLHRDRTFHYENPERIAACISALVVAQQWNHTRNLELVDIAPPIYDSVTPESFRSMAQHRTRESVTPEELTYARNVLLQTHQAELVTQLEERCYRSKEQRIQLGKSSLGYIGYLDGGDTYVTTETYEVCLRATVAWIRAVNYCWCNHTHNYISLACTRPPGHHATYNLQNGFCLFNFAAAAAIHAITRCDGIQKVSILDWDVHYGQGVADIVSRYDGSIRYVSIHQTPAFPYEGEQRQTRGNVMTLPIPVETSWSCGYSEIFDQALQFCATAGEWEPELVIVCAGYDALFNDELANVNLDAADFGRMSTRLCQHLRKTCPTKVPKLMLGLEGGYRIGNAGTSGNLPDAIVETVQALMEQPYL
jgi:acetoin utilization deacetylase AcuC-like enzyme